MNNNNIIKILNTLRSLQDEGKEYHKSVLELRNICRNIACDIGEAINEDQQLGKGYEIYCNNLIKTITYTCPTTGLSYHEKMTFEGNCLVSREDCMQLLQDIEDGLLDHVILKLKKENKEAKTALNKHITTIY